VSIPQSNYSSEILLPYHFVPSNKPPKFEWLAQATRDVWFRYRFTAPRGIDYINQAVLELTGYAQGEFYTNPDLFFRLIHPEDGRRLQRTLMEGEGHRPIKIRIKRKEGSYVLVDLVLSPVYDEHGFLANLEGVIRLAPTDASRESRVSILIDRLLEVYRGIPVNENPEDALRQVFGFISDTLFPDICTLWMKSEDDSLISLMKSLVSESPSWQFSTGRLAEGCQVEHLVAASGQPAIDPDFNRMWIPIHWKHSVVGMIKIFRLNLPFEEDEYELSQICGLYISLTVENILLGKETSSCVELIENLVPSGGVESGSSIESVGESIGREALRISGADRVSVLHQIDDQLHPIWSRGLSEAYLAHLAISNDPGQPEAEMLERQAILYPTAGFDPEYTSDIRDLPEESVVRLLAEAEGYRSLVHCPLPLGKQAIAAVSCYYNNLHRWSLDERRAMELFSRQAASALENTRLYIELEDAYFQTVLTLARAIDARDAYTADHSRRMANWAEATARLFGFSPAEIQMIRWAALLHDIGKIGVPDAILRKAGPLTDDEWQVMRQHPVLGAEIVAPIKKLQPVTAIIRAHQEKIDGTGYPDGLKGEQIPLPARILTVVDAYAAMTDDRVFRKARSRAEATAELERCSGTHFDNQIVEAFFRLIHNGAIS
jgi:putative nucleotidyltransferase with HDIG domain